MKHLLNFWMYKWKLKVPHLKVNWNRYFYIELILFYERTYYLDISIFFIRYYPTFKHPKFACNVLAQIKSCMTCLPYSEPEEPIPIDISAKHGGENSVIHRSMVLCVAPNCKIKYGQGVRVGFFCPKDPYMCKKWNFYYARSSIGALSWYLQSFLKI